MSRTMMILIALLLVSAAAATTFDPDVASITETINQSDSWSYDFNSSYANATPIPEDGTKVTYVIDDTNLSGLSIVANTGVISFTPENSDVGTYGIYVDLRNKSTTLREDSVFINLTILNINDAPEITSSTPTSPISASENETINLTLNATDPDRFYGETVNATWIIERPINSTYTETSELSSIPGQGTLNYTIGFCDAGALTITGVAEDDEGLNDTTVWTVNVADTNRDVTFNGSIADQTFTENEGLVANFTYDERFIDQDDLICSDETLTFSLDGASNTSLSVNTTSGAVTFNASSGWSGNETVTITASDGSSNVTSNSFTIEVLASADDPVGIATSDRVVYEGVSFEIFVRFEDPDLPYGDSLSYTLNDTTLTSSPISVSLHNVSGNASYARINATPVGADVGNHSYRVIANDSTGRTANVTFGLEVRENSAPNITTPVIIPEATQDAPYTALINGTEADGEAISWYVSIAQANGSLDASSFGTPYDATIGGYPLTSVNDTQAQLSFTPENEDVGNYTLVIYATDTRGAVTNTTTQLRVSNVNDAPVNLAPTGRLKAKTDTQWNYTASVDDLDFEYGDYVTIAVNDTNITITNTTTNGSHWLMSWTPAVSDVGNRTIRINATDSSGASTSETFVLEVLEPAGPTIIVPTDLTAQASVSYETTIEAHDPNGDPITISYNESVWSSNVASTTDNTSTINATYGSGAVGNYSINITAYDAADNLSDSIIVSFTIEPFNLAPNLSDARDISFVVSNTTTHNFTVQDAESDNWTAYWEGSTLDWITVTKVNETLLQLSGTPNTSHVGASSETLVLNQTDYPPRNTTYVINVTVFSDPQEPEITGRNPISNPSGTEGSSRVFSVTVDDPNFPAEGTNETDRVTIEWIYGGEIVRTVTVNETTTDEYTFEYDYCTAPGGTLEVNVTDLSSLTDQTSWTVTITDVNRAPYFGEKRLSYDVISNAEDLSYATGSWTSTNVVDTSSALRQENSSVTGTITSAVLDLGRENSINKANITSLSTSGSGPVYYELRFNTNSPNPSDPSWSDWTDPVSAGSAPTNYTIRQYVQIRFTLNSSDAGNLSTIENATLNYEFSNETLNSSSTFLDYYYLDDYFTDDDFIECSGETVNATIEDSSPELVMTIDDLSRTVDIVTDTSFGYTHLAQFVYTDSSGTNVTSNEFAIEVVERPNQVSVPQPVSGGGGGGGGGGASSSIVTEPEEVEVPEPEPLEIITPGSVTMYSNQTLSIPISIVNRWNETLENIAISAESENPNTSVSLGLDSIPSLASGVNRTFNLTVTSYATYGEYAVRVFATVQDPEFNSSSTILISSIELGRAGNETFNTKLTFARDIVSSNPRCLELNEQIERARDLITGGAASEAATLLDDIVENCRYLIGLDDGDLAGNEPEGFFERFVSETSTETKVYAAVIISVNVLLLVLVAVYLFRNRKTAAS